MAMCMDRRRGRATVVTISGWDRGPNYLAFHPVPVHWTGLLLPRWAQWCCQQPLSTATPLAAPTSCLKEPGETTERGAMSGSQPQNTAQNSPARLSGGLPWRQPASQAGLNGRRIVIRTTRHPKHSCCTNIQEPLVFHSLHTCKVVILVKWTHLQMN